MIDKVLNKFDFSNPKSGKEVMLFMLAVWLMVVGSSIWSVLSQRRPMTWKLIWIMVIVFVPLLGVAAYLPFSLKDETFPLTGRWRDPK
jgi:hypothetical protein